MKLTVQDIFGEEQSFQTPSGPTLLNLLQDQSIPINAACGGNGSCHKCRIQVQDGFLAISETDKNIFSEKELSQGWRLSCQSRPKTSCQIKIPLTVAAKTRARTFATPFLKNNPDVTATQLICDLGSTGVVVAAIDADGNILSESHILNEQVKFGLDVMTRLQKVQQGQGAQLTESLHRSIEKALTALKGDFPKLFKGPVQKGGALTSSIFCAGNSCMVSLLHNWNTETLAVSPFQPTTTASAETHSALSTIQSFITPPLLGGFVGADTTMGILYIEKKLQPTQTWMLIDIGTNTEVVLSDGKSKKWFCSAPAGPAFEGGNITNGMRAEPGAISDASYNSQTHHWDIQTIGKDRAVGICGSGLIDILAQSVRHGLITPDGYLPDGSISIFDTIHLSADDVREFQLAKSATLTACEVLFNIAGFQPRHIYLAGQFATHVNLENAVQVGLLPENITTEKIGNASLLGTAIYAGLSTSERKEFESTLQHQSQQVELALENQFQDLFVTNLNF